MTTRSPFAVAALALAAAFACGAQAQDKPVALKLSSWVPAQHALNPALAAGISVNAGTAVTGINFTVQPVASVPTYNPNDPQSAGPSKMLPAPALVSTLATR